MSAATIAFVVLAIPTAVAAIGVVRSSNLVHAVAWLAGTLLGTAGLFALWDAPFLSGVQVLTYVGGVVTLMIFGIMVTRRHDGSPVETGVVRPAAGAAVALALFVVLALAVTSSDLRENPADAAPTTRELGAALTGEHLLAFEAASVLLLAAIVGAVVLARRRDPGADATDTRDVPREDATVARHGPREDAPSPLTPRAHAVDASSRHDGHAGEAHAP